MFAHSLGVEVVGLGVVAVPDFAFDVVNGFARCSSVDETDPAVGPRVIADDFATYESLPSRLWRHFLVEFREGAALESA